MIACTSVPRSGAVASPSAGSAQQPSTGTAVSPVPIVAPTHTAVPVFSPVPAAARHSIYVTASDGSLFVINPTTHALSAPLLAGWSAHLVTSPNGSIADLEVTEDYTSGSTFLVPFNLATGAFGKPVSLASCCVNAINPDGKTGYSISNGSLVPIDLATGVAAAPIHITSGANLPQSMALSPDGSMAYLTNGSESRAALIPVNLKASTALAPIDFPPDPNLGAVYAPIAVAITPDGRTAYVSANAAAAGGLVPVNLVTSTAGAWFPIGGSPLSAGVIVISGNTAYTVPNGYSTSPGGSSAVLPSLLTPVDLTSNTALAPLAFPSGAYPTDIVISSDGSTAYVLTGPYPSQPATATSNAVFILPLGSSSLGAIIVLPAAPTGLAVAP
jgi:hypothetical protein